MARRCCLACLSVLKLLTLVLFLAQAAAAGGPDCHCQPSQACWPTPSTWQAFNQSVDGRLIATRPPGARCHSPSYDPAACSDVVQNAADPFWRADQPGALQSPANEQLVPGQSCLPQPNSTSPCYQGAVPLYAVNVSKPVHVQKTVVFASRHNLRLVIKNSGHDLTGRNTAPNSLSVWVHGLRSIDFVPNKNNSLVKVQAGVLWEELFKAADVHNRTMAGSECTSVGAAGGYVQGGGHSPLSPSFGLAADNIVEYEVVTADGRLLVANSCKNRDLFWALRGGGGGTFGVVTSATYSTHPALSSLVFASYTIASSSRSTFRSFLSYFLADNPRLSDQRWGGVFLIGNKSVNIELLMPNRGRAFAELTFQPLLSYARALNMTVTGTMTSFPSYYAWHLATQCSNGKCGFPSGFSAIEASRLIPRTTLQASSQQLAGALLSMHDALQYLVRFAGYLVAGGQVASPVRPDNAVNPAWRHAVLHVLVVQALPDNLSDAAKQALRTQLTAAVQKLRDLTPGSGTYLNEGDINEPDWQRAFFGSNYGQLKAVKRAVDPNGLFLCRHCVGFEDYGCAFA